MRLSTRNGGMHIPPPLNALGRLHKSSYTNNIIMYILYTAYLKSRLFSEAASPWSSMHSNGVYKLPQVMLWCQQMHAGSIAFIMAQHHYIDPIRTSNILADILMHCAACSRDISC